MKQPLFLICLFCLINSNQLFSQSTGFINGRVINSKTQEPLPFAAIALKDNKLGVFSNIDGDFKIASNPKFQSDSLMISFIGYKKSIIPFNSLHENIVNKIFLVPVSLELNEIAVEAKRKKINPETIIRNAIENLSKNYPVKPFNYVSYYRDYQKREKKYFNLNEAIIQTLDNGFNELSATNKYRLLDFKQNMDFQRLDVSPFYDQFNSSSVDNPNKFIQNASLPDQGGNELLILMIHDPIRNFQSETFSFVNVFSKNFIAHHNFSNITSVYDNNLLLYKIGFNAKHYLTGDFLTISGNIYIHPEDYAIYKLEYTGYYLLKGNLKKKMFDVDIEYGRENSEKSIMGLKYISFNNIFNVADKADTTFFRVVKSSIEKGDPSNSTLIVEFNHFPNVESASNKDFYEIQIDGKIAIILSVKVVGKNAIIKINPVSRDSRIKPRIEVAISKVKDKDGKILNKRVYSEFYQYRELFVQEYNKPIQFKESCFLQNVPLIQNCISKYTGDQKYWMNTPINTDTLSLSLNGNLGDLNSLTTAKVVPPESFSEKLPVNLTPGPVTRTNSVPDLTDAPIEKYLTNQQKLAGSDQVFVQLDRNSYKPGDTIYFNAYIRNQFTTLFETRSVSMYALLYDDNKMLIDSSRFKISNSAARGWLAIPVKTKPGKCHFVAFTSVMQNYDPADAFQLDLFVKKPDNNPDKIEITFNKEKYKPGDIMEATIKIKDITGKPINQQKFTGSFSSGNIEIGSTETKTNLIGESLIKFTLPDSISALPHIKISIKGEYQNESIVKDVSIPIEDPYFELKFLPEGGTFVEGLNQRIGFNATNYKGEPVLIEGLLKNSSGTILDTIKSGIYGPGSFSCTAQSGLYVELLKEGGSEIKWPLPVPVVNGVSLHVTPIDHRSFAVEIQSNSYNGEPIIVSGTMNMTQVFSQEVLLRKKQRIVINTDQLPAGIANITLFNKDLKPLAERLFYINSDKHLQFRIKTDKVYKGGQETELAISVTDGQGNPSEGFFSIAVTDSVKGIDSRLLMPGIEYALIDHPHLLYNLPSKVLSKGLENMTEAERDLILMVFGWSKFNWDFIPAKQTDKQLANYDLLNMKILYAMKRHRGDRTLDLISLEGPSVKHLVTNNLGEISLPLDSLTEITRSVTLMPDINNKQNAKGAMLSIPFNEQYFKSNRLFIPQPIIQTENYNTLIPISNTPLDEKTIQLREVEIEAHHQVKKVYHDQYEERYQNRYIRSMDPEILRTSFDLTSAINQMNFGIGKCLIVLDGQPLYNQSFDLVKTILPGDITSFTVLKGKGGYARYGEQAKDGVIFINTVSQNPSLMKVRTKWISQNAKDKMLVPIDLYRPNIEFYNPTKHDIESDPTFQSRATILWQPEVYFDGKEPVKIKYSNLKHAGSILITINGVSVNNLIGSGRAGYQVQ